MAVLFVYKFKCKLNNNYNIFGHNLRKPVFKLSLFTMSIYGCISLVLPCSVLSMCAVGEFHKH